MAEQGIILQITQNMFLFFQQSYSTVMVAGADPSGQCHLLNSTGNVGTIRSLNESPRSPWSICPRPINEGEMKITEQYARFV